MAQPLKKKEVKKFNVNDFKSKIKRALFIRPDKLISNENMHITLNENEKIVVEDFLGDGGQGEVYLVFYNGGMYALKQETPAPVAEEKPVKKTTKKAEPKKKATAKKEVEVKTGETSAVKNGDVVKTSAVKNTPVKAVKFKGEEEND